jgi:hypothetical protein
MRMPESERSVKTGKLSRQKSGAYIGHTNQDPPGEREPKDVPMNSPILGASADSSRLQSIPKVVVSLDIVIKIDDRGYEEKAAPIIRIAAKKQGGKT